MSMFKKTTLALAISALAGGALAQSAPAPAPAPATSPITANITVVNDYRYRGISQSNFQPAIQGGFDYAHESGFYIGNWNSSISWLSDSYSVATSVQKISAPVEMDFYAGFKKELIGPGFASDIGVLQYYYPISGNLDARLNNVAANRNGAGRQATGQSPNTTEAYIAQNFTFGPVTGFVKFSYALTNLFGFYDSKGSYYPDLTVNYDTGVWGLTLNGHVGYQYIANNKPGYDFSYTDYKLGVTKDFGGGLSANISYVGTDAKSVGGTPLYVSPTGNKNWGKDGYLISLTKTF
ncbi:MAG: hypothetical protein EBT04_16370 [Betaproteobacteria bacterium]|nr:hypothetical protein [Betaproteobacteria bacterium]